MILVGFTILQCSTELHAGVAGTNV